MKPTIKIRFTESQIALVMRAHPNCNLGRLTEVSFEFDQGGKLVDCIGTINGGNIEHDYAGSGLAQLYKAARRLFTAGTIGATILCYPGGKRLANTEAGGAPPPPAAFSGPAKTQSPRPEA
jgi:hypothetical protein